MSLSEINTLMVRMDLWLIIAAVLLSAARGSLVAFCFTVINWAAWNIPDGILIGYSYYAGSALIDLAMIFIVLKLPHSDLSETLGAMGFLSILFNGAGWLLWFLYFDPFVYNLSQCLVYLAICLIITDKWCANGVATLTRRGSYFLRANLSRLGMV